MTFIFFVFQCTVYRTTGGFTTNQQIAYHLFTTVCNSMVIGPVNSPHQFPVFDPRLMIGKDERHLQVSESGLSINDPLNVFLSALPYGLPALGSSAVCL